MVPDPQLTFPLCRRENLGAQKLEEEIRVGEFPALLEGLSLLRRRMRETLAL